MLSPNAETIEGAAENLQRDPKTATFPADYPTLTEFMLTSQLKELDAFGPGRLDDLRKITLPASDMPEDFSLGYLLGLQTARFVLLGSVPLLMKQIEAKDVL